MKLVYKIDQNPPLRKNLIYAFQQLLAIMAATLLVPILVDGTGTYMSQPAALCGAGFGTLFYLFIATRRKSPVFLGSSFAFISPLASAVAFGYLGIFLGAVFAGLVYVIIALIIKFTGSAWVNKLLPPVVIGPTVALIGLSLCGSAINNLANLNGNETILNLTNFAGGTLNVSQFLSGKAVYEGVQNISTNFYNLFAILVGVIAFLITGFVCSLSIVQTTWKTFYKTIAIRKGVYYLCFPIGCAFSVVHLIDLILNRKPEDAPKALRGEEGIDV